MSPKAEPPFEHPLRARNAVPRSDVKRVTQGLSDALDTMLEAHAGADGAQAHGKDTPEKAKFLEELTRCVGGRVGVTAIAVGDVVVQIVCEDEAGAAAVSAVINHTGVGGKASWFKGEDEKMWVVVIVPSR